MNSTAMDLQPRFDRWGLTVKVQGARGTCSVFAVTGALEYALSRRRRHGVRLSEEFLNWAKNRAAGTQKDGDFFDRIWDGYRAFGICPAEDLPYSSTYNPDLQPPPRALADALSNRRRPLTWTWIKRWNVETGLSGPELDEIRMTIRKGYPVCAGLRWPQRPVYVDGVLQLSSQVFDGHSILIVGFQDTLTDPGGGRLIYRDSGAGQYNSMSYGYALAYTNDAGWIR